MNRWRQASQWGLGHGRRPVALTACASILWLALWADAHFLFHFSPLIHAICFGLALPVPLSWARYWRSRSLLLHRLILSGSFIPLWQFAVTAPLVFSAYQLSEALAHAGVAIFFVIGLGWAVWLVDRKTKQLAPSSHQQRSWNPLRRWAWYFGRRSPKLWQSTATLGAYSALFLAAFLIFNSMTGCAIYESPYGGGEEERLRQVVRIQKVVKKKYIINPYSSILFNPPPIDDVRLQLLEETAHRYKVGQGEGRGAGFSGGTSRGKVRFIRLKYNGGDWQQDMDRGADLNLLTEYGVRTGHRVSDRPEPMDIKRLRAFPARKSPPMVYMTGQQNIQVGEDGVRILRAYLLDKHGMLFGDNGGSSGWEGQFVGMMKKVLPKVEPITVYLDHQIHQVPYVLPKLPYVAKHGRSDALGWVVDGRLVAYYHPGDIGDAWADGHSGVSREIWESCFQLGVNIIFYAHAEYNKWLEATKED
ncbi:MAG: DUF4159 domain-containing protein [Roseibacillus sp.]|nr:DUF4159 domain-containing protein [Roseibacillus sp.]